MSTHAQGAPAPIVTLHDGQAVTTSVAVAEYFGKQHAHVLRDIEKLKGGCPDEFGRSNFGETSYLDEQGKENPCYELTKNGFALLAMGFTGAKALAFKLAYIEAFDRMEAALAQRLADQLPPRFDQEVGAFGRTLLQQANTNIGRYFPRSSQQTGYRLRHAVQIRFRVKRVEEVPIANFHDLRRMFIDFHRQSYQLWWCCQAYETALLQTFALNANEEPIELPDYVQSDMAKIPLYDIADDDRRWPNLPM